MRLTGETFSLTWSLAWLWPFLSAYTAPTTASSRAGLVVMELLSLGKDDTHSYLSDRVGHTSVRLSSKEQGWASKGRAIQASPVGSPAALHGPQSRGGWGCLLQGSRAPAELSRAGSLHSESGPLRGPPTQPGGRGPGPTWQELPCVLRKATSPLWAVCLVDQGGMGQGTRRVQRASVHLTGTEDQPWGHRK